MGYLEDLRTKLAYLEQSGEPNAAAAELVRQEIEAEEAQTAPPKRRSRAKTDTVTPDP